MRQKTEILEVTNLEDEFFVGSGNSWNCAHVCWWKFKNTYSAIVTSVWLDDLCPKGYPGLELVYCEQGALIISNSEP